MKKKRAKPLDEFDAEEALRGEGGEWLHLLDEGGRKAVERASRQEEHERHAAETPGLPDADLGAPAWRDDVLQQETYAFSLEAYRRYREVIDREGRAGRAMRAFALSLRDASAKLAGAMSIGEIEDDAVLGLAIAYHKRAAGAVAEAAKRLERIPSKGLGEGERAYFEKKAAALEEGIALRVRELRGRWLARFGRLRDDR
jgi:hypothetical protein